MNITEILNQAESAPLTREQIVALLNTDNHSPAFYQLLSKANEMSRKGFELVSATTTGSAKGILVFRGKGM